jgi:hypothetical protein
MMGGADIRKEVTEFVFKLFDFYPSPVKKKVYSDRQNLSHNFPVGSRWVARLHFVSCFCKIIISERRFQNIQDIQRFVILSLSYRSFKNS